MIIMGDKPINILKFNEVDRQYQCYIYALNAELPEEYNELQSFYDIWNIARGDQPIPNINDISFESLKGWHASVRTVEYGEDLFGPKIIKIMGEKFSNLWGRNSMYNRIKSDTPPPQDIIDKYYKYLKAIYDKNFCLAKGYTTAENGAKQHLIWIDLPLTSGTDKVTHAIGAVVSIGETQ